MEKHLYKVSIGLIENDEIIPNWSSKNVIAKDAQEAINKARLNKKKQFAEEVELIARVDVS